MISALGKFPQELTKIDLTSTISSQESTDPRKSHSITKKSNGNSSSLLAPTVAAGRCLQLLVCGDHEDSSRGSRIYGYDLDICLFLWSRCHLPRHNYTHHFTSPRLARSLLTQELWCLVIRWAPPRVHYPPPAAGVGRRRQLAQRRRRFSCPKYQC